MIQTIPNKFNRFPVYYNPTPPTPPGPDYVNMPLTYECINGTATVKFPLYRGSTEQSSSSWGGENSPITSLFYRKYDGSDWGEWVNWKAAKFAAVTLTQGQKMELSGANGTNFSRAWGQYFNKFMFGGTASSLIMYGNISSMFVPNLTSIHMQNVWWQGDNGTSVLVDASKLVVPYYGDILQAFNFFSQNRALTGAPLFLNKSYYYPGDGNGAFVNVCNGTQVQYMEVSFETSYTWKEIYAFKVVTTSGMFIKSPNAPNPPKGNVNSEGASNNYIPNAWIILNRMSDGSLQVAENTKWRGRNYTSGYVWGSNNIADEYDPYAWYYNK